jgi:mRNA interferase MazF
MAITSQLHIPGGLGEVVPQDWRGAGLIKPSALKPVFATLEQSLVIREPGALSQSDLEALRRVIAAVLV